MNKLLKMFDNNILSMLSLVLIGIAFGAVIKGGLTSDQPVKESIVYTDTLTLENQSEVDLYQVNDGRWLVISLDDLKYITKKRKKGKETISNLETLFERFEVPKNDPVKPVFE